MGEIFKSAIPCDESKLPVLPFTDYLFQRLQKVLPLVATKPWLLDMTSDKKILFGDVESQAKKVASALTKRGFKKGDSLYFVCYDIVDMGILQLAVWTLGGVTRGSFQQESPDEYARQMLEINCKFVAVDSQTATMIKEAIVISKLNCELINVGVAPVEGAIAYSEMAIDDGKAFPREVKINPKEDVLLICNTSGSSGNPKGVVHTHYTILSVLTSLAGIMNINVNESNLMTASNFAISNAWTTSAHLIGGNTLFCMSRYRKEEFIGHILKHRPTKIFLYPYIAGWFARSPELAEHDFSFITNVMFGGSVTDPTTMQLLQKNLPHAFMNPAYASTECFGVTASFNSTKFTFPLYNKTPDGETMVTSGMLFPAVQAKVLDSKSGELLGRNQLGRLYVKSPFIMKGYLKKDNELDRSEIDEEGWFNTGDIAFFDEICQLYVRERASSMFKYYMHYVNPSEIEAVLQEHSSVQMACVIGIPNEETTNLAKALVVLKEGKTATEEELLKLVAERLPFYKHLYGGLKLVDSLPENRGRKVDRVAIMKMYSKSE